MVHDIDKIKKYLEENVAHYQINIVDKESIEIQINDNDIKNSKTTKAQAYEITIYVEDKGKVKRIMQSFTDPSIKNMQSLIELAKASEPLEYFYGLPKQSKFSKVSFDKDILNTDRIKDHFNILKQRCKDYKVSDARISVSSSNISLLNSNGIDSSFKSSSYSSFVCLVGGSDAYEDISLGRAANDDEFEDMLNVAISKYEDFKKSTKLKEKKLSVVLKPDVINQLLSYAYIPNLYATNIEHKRSFLNFEDIGKKLTKTNISFVDDPFMKDSIMESFDFEGNKTFKKPIIDNGILSTPLTDFNLSKKFKLQNTANSSSINSVAFSNLELDGDEQDYNKAIIIDSVLGAHTSNSITTDFSVSVDKAYFVDGSKRTPVKDFFISGKVKDVLNSAYFVDKKEFRGDILTKSLLSKDISIILE